MVISLPRDVCVVQGVHTSTIPDSSLALWKECYCVFCIYSTVIQEITGQSHIAVLTWNLESLAVLTGEEHTQAVLTGKERA